MWFSDKHFILFIKLHRQKIETQLEINDFKNSKLQISENKKSLFLISEKENLIWKLKVNDLRTSYKKELPNGYSMNFLNNKTFVMIVKDLEFPLSDLDKNVQFDDEYDQETCYSILLICPDLLENKSYFENKGVVELIRTNSEIVQYSFVKHSLNNFEISVLCEENRSCSINFVINQLNDQLSICHYRLTKMFDYFNSDFVLSKDLSKKVIKKLVTDEFFESNIQVLE